LKVLIDARLPDFGSGGVQQVLKTMAKGFGSLVNSEFEFTWVVYEKTNWWKPFINDKDEIVQVKIPLSNSIFPGSHIISKILRKFPWLMNQSRKMSNSPIKMDLSKFDLIHFPFQDAFPVDKPYLYHPHDLQHKYLPENFNHQQILSRETCWKTFARKATVVIVESEFVKSDLISFWGLEDNKISIITTPPIKLNSRTSTWSFDQSENFIFYPAAFWPHKNHENLLIAMYLLKNTFRLDCRLILTGAFVGNYKRIKNLVTFLDLESQVVIKGHVMDEEVADLMRRARILAVPSRFESVSLPIWEAMEIGLPVVASNFRGLADQVGALGNIFDPDDPLDIARLILQLWDDEFRLKEISDLGLEKASHLSIDLFTNEILNSYRSVLNEE
jgi:glycosyltransferase involved in cell wall biosynthesis